MPPPPPHLTPPPPAPHQLCVGMVPRCPHRYCNVQNTLHSTVVLPKSDIAVMTPSKNMEHGSLGGELQYVGQQAMK